MTEAHLATHGISFDDVQQTLFSADVWVANRREGETRWKIVGFDRGDRPLTIVFAYDSIRRALRPITGWGVTPSERSKYLKD